MPNFRVSYASIIRYNHTLMETLRCDREISVGAEHRVYLSEDGRTVVKAPTEFGKAWHKMGADLAERDQILLDVSDIPHIPTEIIEGPVIIELKDGTRREVDYVMRQPYIPSAVTLEFNMLKDDPDLLDEFREIVEKAETLFNETGFGVDFVGGHAIKELLLAPFRWEVRGAVYNVLLPQADQYDEGGNKFAEKGRPILCDTRLYDCSGFFGNLLSRVRRDIQRLQNEILYSFLKELEEGSSRPPRKIQLETLIHRIAAWGSVNLFGCV